MAQSALGNFYASGFHVPVSQSKALLYWQFAALDGNREANLALGYRYYNGIGLKKNCKKASEHYSRVAADVATDTQVFVFFQFFYYRLFFTRDYLMHRLFTKFESLRKIGLQKILQKFY